MVTLSRKGTYMSHHNNEIIIDEEIRSSLPQRVRDFQTREQRQLMLLAAGLEQPELYTLAITTLEPGAIDGLSTTVHQGQKIDLNRVIAPVEFNVKTPGRSVYDLVMLIVNLTITTADWLQIPVDQETFDDNVSAWANRLVKQTTFKQVVSTGDQTQIKRFVVSRFITFNKKASKTAASKKKTTPETGSSKKVNKIKGFSPVRVIKLYHSIMTVVLGDTFKHSAWGEVLTATALSVRVYDRNKVQTAIRTSGTSLVNAINPIVPDHELYLVIDGNGIGYFAGFGKRRPISSHGDKIGRVFVLHNSLKKGAKISTVTQRIINGIRHGGLKVGNLLTTVGDKHFAFDMKTRAAMVRPRQQDDFMTVFGIATLHTNGDTKRALKTHKAYVHIKDQRIEVTETLAKDYTVGEPHPTHPMATSHQTEQVPAMAAASANEISGYDPNAKGHTFGG